MTRELQTIWIAAFARLVMVVPEPVAAILACGLAALVLCGARGPRGMVCGKPRGHEYADEPSERRHGNVYDDDDGGGPPEPCEQCRAPAGQNCKDPGACRDAREHVELPAAWRQAGIVPQDVGFRASGGMMRASVTEVSITGPKGTRRQDVTDLQITIGQGDVITAGVRSDGQVDIEVKGREEREACPDCRGACEGWTLDGEPCGGEPESQEQRA